MEDGSFQNKMNHMFLQYTEPPKDLVSFYEKVGENDPIRDILKDIGTFEDAVVSLDENDFENYGFFIHVENPKTHVARECNFFTQKHNIVEGVFKAIPPMFIYKKVLKPKWVYPYLVLEQKNWLIGSILTKQISGRDTTITFVADHERRCVRASSLIRDALRIGKDDVPLLVFDGNTKNSLDFAEFVIGLLHKTQEDDFISFLNDHFQIQRMSIDKYRKMYDIFPEEYISIPMYIWNTLKSIDHYEYSDADIKELADKYKK